MLQGWIPGKVLSYNAPGWTLCVELFFYISFPFLFNYIYRSTNYRRLIAPILLIWLATQVVLNGFLQSHFYKGFPSISHDLLFFNPLMHINEFLVGNLAGLFFINNQPDNLLSFSRESEPATCSTILQTYNTDGTLLVASQKLT